jgi:hypothetical protein
MFYPFPLRGKEVIIMDTFLEFLKEVMKGIIRALSAYLFRETFLNKEKTTQRRHKHKGDSHKN